LKPHRLTWLPPPSQKSATCCLECGKSSRAMKRPGLEAFERFQAATQALLQVPKSEIAGR
jgi:hypothetical protein